MNEIPSITLASLIIEHGVNLFGDMDEQLNALEEALYLHENKIICRGSIEIMLIEDYIDYIKRMTQLPDFLPAKIQYTFWQEVKNLLWDFFYF